MHDWFHNQRQSVSERKFRRITLQIVYRMTEAFGESTDRHRALMQNNTAIDFLTDQYGFSRLTGKAKIEIMPTVSTQLVPKCKLDSLGHCFLIFWSNKSAARKHNDNKRRESKTWLPKKWSAGDTIYPKYHIWTRRRKHLKKNFLDATSNRTPKEDALQWNKLTDNLL